MTVAEKDYRVRRSFASEELVIFPGISITYCDAHTKLGALCGQAADRDTFEIIHCREGRMESIINNEFCYISSGDIMIAKVERMSSSVSFPFGHYHGMIIRIAKNEAPRCLSCFLQDVSVRPQKIEQKFCGESGYFIARSSPALEHIFAELYSVPQEIRQGYFKIKFLELMLFLSAYDIEAHMHERSAIPFQQVELAKNVAKYISDNMDAKITLSEVAKRFHVSATTVKNSVKAVYGVSFQSFTKAQKMESSAYMLEFSTRSVLEIAGLHGYDNASKFSAAFRSVKGASPKDYRAKCLCRKQDTAQAYK